MSTNVIDSRIAARVSVVEEHVRLENAHDLDGVMATFGMSARYHDEPYGAIHAGHDQVRAYYAAIFSAMPDMNIEVRKRHVGEDSIILEVVITGHHLGAWRGLPPTGRRVEFPLCAIYTFDEANRLAGERIYYDRTIVLRQLGVFHEPETLRGRINVLLMHPLTLVRVIVRRLFGR